MNRDFFAVWRTNMLGFAILDVAIGLSFVYLMLSLICTTINEVIAGILKMRAKTLWDGVVNLMGPTLAREIYGHPAVDSLSKPGSKPSYIPKETFAAAVMDHLAGKGQPLGPSVASLADSPGKNWLAAALRRAGDDAEQMEKIVGEWYDASMDRVSGWYKRKAALITALVAAVLTVMTNADTLAIGKKLWLDPTLRAAVVEQAKVRSAEPPPPVFEYENPDTPDPTPSKPVEHASAGLSDQEQKLLGQLLGWTGEDAQKTWQAAALQHSLGWIFTTLALMLGAPFWFDQLKKLMSFRTSGKPAATEPAKG